MKRYFYIIKPFAGIGCVAIGVLFLVAAFFVDAPRLKNFMLLGGLFAEVLGTVLHVVIIRRTSKY